VADTSGRHPGSISFGLTTNPQASEMPFLMWSVGLSLHGGGINPPAMPIFYQKAGSDEHMCNNV